MNAAEQRTLLGSAILNEPANVYRLRVGVIGAVETSMSGNVVLRTGHTEYGMDTWESASSNPHIVLSPAEVDELIERLQVARAAGQPGERTEAAALEPGWRVTVFAHPRDRFNVSSGRDVSGWVRSVEPLDLPGTTTPGVRITFTDGRTFDAVAYAVATHHHAGD